MTIPPVAAPSDAESHLRRDDLGSSLHRRAGRGAAATVGAQLARTVLQFGSTAVLARLLTPDDFGLVAMVLAVTALADQFKGMGLSAATVQREHVDQRQVSALFWVNSLVGLCLALLVMALAVPIANFYGRPELIGITLVLSLSFVASGLSVQHHALLLRRLRFASIAKVDVAAIAVGVGVGIGSGVAGFGYWALVFLQVSMALTRALLLWVVCRWRPNRPRRGVGIRDLLAFGGNLSLFNLLNYVARNADNLLVGKFVGAGALGIYSRAYALLLLPLRQINQPISNVAVPTLSHLRGEPGRYRSYYGTALGAVAVVGLPLVILLAVLSEEIILVFLGEQWLAAAPVFRVLAVAGILQTISSTTGWIYISWGNTRRMARWALVSRPIVVLSFVAGLPWGPLGVAAAYSICQAVLIVPSFALALRGTAVRMTDVLGAVWRPTLLCIAMLVVAVVVRVSLSGLPPFVVAAITTVVAGSAYAAAIALWPTLRAEIRKVASSLRRSPVPTGT